MENKCTPISDHPTFSNSFVSFYRLYKVWYSYSVVVLNSVSVDSSGLVLDGPDISYTMETVNVCGKSSFCDKILENYSKYFNRTGNLQKVRRTLNLVKVTPGKKLINLSSTPIPRFLLPRSGRTLSDNSNTNGWKVEKVTGILKYFLTVHCRRKSLP